MENKKISAIEVVFYFMAFVSLVVGIRMMFGEEYYPYYHHVIKIENFVFGIAGAAMNVFFAQIIMWMRMIYNKIK